MNTDLKDIDITTLPTDMMREVWKTAVENLNTERIKNANLEQAIADVSDINFRLMRAALSAARTISGTYAMSHADKNQILMHAIQILLGVYEDALLPAPAEIDDIPF